MQTTTEQARPSRVAVQPSRHLLSLLYSFSDFFRGRSALGVGLEAADALDLLGAAEVAAVSRGEEADPDSVDFVLLPGQKVTAEDVRAAWPALREWGVLMTTGGIGYREVRRALDGEPHFFLPLGPDADGRYRPFRPPLWGRTMLLVQRIAQSHSSSSRPRR